MSEVLIVAHHERADVAILAMSIARWLGERGHSVWMTPSDAEALDLFEFASTRPAAEASLVLTLGGDGTMLRAVRLLEGATVPLLGVNLGWLGYLTEVEPPEVLDALERFFAGEVAGRWSPDERMMLQIRARTRSGEALGSWMALNEVVVEKRESGHTIRLLVSIDGEAFTSYSTDGMVVSTPTGSTAYSLSARGPIVSPRHRALLLTPVAPHTLFDRSLVLDPSEIVDLEVIGHREAVVSVDGQRAAVLGDGDVVTCAPAATSARFVRFSDRRFHQILKAKFGLTDR